MNVSTYGGPKFVLITVAVNAGKADGVNPVDNRNQAPLKGGWSSL